jgi:hypothetical protein
MKKRVWKVEGTLVIDALLIRSIVRERKTIDDHAEIKYKHFSKVFLSSIIYISTSSISA